MAMDPLEAAREELKSLRDADDWDEPTGRTDVHVHVERDSKTSDPPKSLAGWFKLALMALGTGLAIGLGALLQQCGQHHP